MKVRSLTTKNNPFYNIAISSLIISSFTVIILVISIPLLYYKVNQQKDAILFKSDKFKVII